MRCSPGVVGPRQTRRGPTNRSRDAGSTAIETAIVAPVLIAIIFAIIQSGLWYHARSVATSAAQVAVTAARTYDGTSSKGQTAGMAYIANVNGLDNPGVSVTRGGAEAIATVTGDMTRIVPVLPLPPIQVQSRAAVERLTG